MTGRRFSVVWPLVVVGLGCGKTAPSVGRVVSFTPPADQDPATLPLPAADGGGIVLAAGSQAQIVWKRPEPGPMTAAAACSRWVTGCVSPDRSLDDCARSVPACATEQPWNEPACCPKSCFQRYVAARQAGTKDIDAFMGIYLDKVDPCIPGLAALVGGQP